MNVEVTSCNLCGCREGVERFANVPDLLLHKSDVTATFVQCRRCGLIYQNPRPLPADMGQHYPKQYHTRNSAGGNWLQQKSLDYGINKRCQFVARHKPSGRLLDVGCSDGLFLLGMRRHGEWDLHGVEPSEDASAAARQAGLQVITGGIEDAAYPDQHFDAVTMWDVLEHVHDPKAVLAKVASLLKPGGIFVVRVPNADSWTAKSFGRWWSGLDSPRHLYVFSPRTLTQYFEQAGLSPVQMSCHFGTYVTVLMSVRFWLSGTAMSTASQDRLMRVLRHPITRVLAAPTAYLAGMGLSGPSLVVAAKRNT